MKIKMEIEFSEKNIEGVIENAIEQGSGYWCYICPESVTIIRDMVSKEEDPYISTATWKAVQRGAIIPIKDAWQNTVLGFLSMDSIEKGLHKCAIEMPECIRNVIDDCDDANDADVIFQFMVMGEYIYG